MATIKGRKVGNRVMASIYLQPEVLEALRVLGAKRDQSVAALMREAVENLLQKYRQYPAVRSRVAGRPVSTLRKPRSSK